MRLLSAVAALVALASPAFAQSTSDDLLGMRTGNAWEYTVESWTGVRTATNVTTSFVRYEAVSDTLIDGVRRYNVSITDEDGASLGICGRLSTSGDASSLALVDGAGTFSCFGGAPHPGLGFGNAQPSTLIDIGGQELSATELRASGSRTEGSANCNTAHTWSRTMALGIGVTSNERRTVLRCGPTPNDGTARLMLSYARIGDTEYGESRITATDAGPGTSKSALVAGPNPARAQTTLRFTLPEAADARLDVHDALGRTVRQLDLGARPAGEGTASVATAGLAPGVYVVRLVAGTTTAQTRLTVIR